MHPRVAVVEAEVAGSCVHSTSLSGQASACVGLRIVDRKPRAHVVAAAIGDVLAHVVARLTTERICPRRHGTAWNEP